MIESGTLPSQRTQVGTLDDHSLGSRPPPDCSPPALLVVGSVVELRAELEWFESCRFSVSAS